MRTPTSCAAVTRSFAPTAVAPVSMARCAPSNASKTTSSSSKHCPLPVTARVLVVDGGASLRCCVLGDFIAELGQKHGWAGMIIWGAVRDSVALGKLDFGLKALGTSPFRPRKTGAGQVDVPVEFGEAIFRPGDWVYADEDGIVISDRFLVGGAPAGH